MKTTILTLGLGMLAVVATACSQSKPVASNDADTATPTGDVVMTSLKIGDPPPAFQVEDVTGPSKGESLCYRCKYSGKPTVAIFAREVNDSVTNLVQEIDKKVAENMDKKLSAFVVLVGDDAAEMKPDLEHLAVAQNIQNTPFTVYGDSAGPMGYGLAPNAKLQVMMWNNDTLKINQEVESGELSKEEVADLVSKTSEILN